MLRIFALIGLLGLGGFGVCAEDQVPQWQGGLRLGMLQSHSDLKGKLGFHGYGFARFQMHPSFVIEWGGGYGQYDGGDFSTDLWMGENRLIFQPSLSTWFYPLFYGGFGGAYHSIHTWPLLATPGAQITGWTLTLPVGLGGQIDVHKNVRLEVTGGYTYTFRDDWNGAMLTKGNDTFFHWTVGLVVGRFDLSRKKSIKKETLRPKTAENQDQDRDGLADGEELKFYNTNPDIADTDGDGLTDFEEVRHYFTNPLSLDSDGDGLMDDEEVRVYKTNPHLSDTDLDGLPDGIEVAKYRTDPTKADTDGDGINDGDEVLRLQDPLTSDGVVVPPKEKDKK